MNARAWVLLWLAGAAIAGCGTTSRSRASASGAVAFANVNIASVADGRIIARQTVVVERGRITRLGPGVRAPRGALVVDGTGKFLVPGLADMHVHLPDSSTDEAMQRVLDLSLANGVTLIRGMQGAASQLAFRRRLQASGAVAPELVLAGPPIAETLTPAQVRERVRQQKAAGYDLIKLIGGLDLPAYQALLAQASESHIPVAGHLPPEIGLEAALRARQASIEHLMGYRAAANEGASALAAAATRTRAAGVWNCPTLDFYAVGRGIAGDEAALLTRQDALFATDEELAQWHDALKANPPPADGAERMRQSDAILVALDRAGAPLLVGSDAPGSFIVPGFGYIDELRQWSRAGLSAASILRAATLSAAQYLGADAAGEVRVGARADLVLLDRNPFDAVDAIAHPAGVMVRGHWLDRAELDRRLLRWRRKP